MQVEFSDEATVFIKQIFSQLTINPSAKDADVTVKLVREVVDKLSI